jgi:hypothetical protein
MAGVQQRLKLKQTPIDTWSVKEHLTLASAVLRTGDQVGLSAHLSHFFFKTKFRVQVCFNEDGITGSVNQNNGFIRIWILSHFLKACTDLKNLKLKNIVT